MDTENKEFINYCITLSHDQFEALHSEHSTIDRYRCLATLVEMAEMSSREYSVKGFKTTIQMGHVAASTVELQKIWKCERRTVSRILETFNKVGIITTVTNNRTSIHAVRILNGWLVGSRFIRNPAWICFRPVNKAVPMKDSQTKVRDTNVPKYGERKNSPAVAGSAQETDNRFSRAEENSAVVTGGKNAQAGPTEQGSNSTSLMTETPGPADGQRSVSCQNEAGAGVLKGGALSSGGPTETASKEADGTFSFAARYSREICPETKEARTDISREGGIDNGF